MEALYVLGRTVAAAVGTGEERGAPLRRGLAEERTGRSSRVGPTREEHRKFWFHAGGEWRRKRMARQTSFKAGEVGLPAGFEEWEEEETRRREMWGEEGVGELVDLVEEGWEKGSKEEAGAEGTQEEEGEIPAPLPGQ